ncbi:hypothetical protein ACYSNW_12425 [Enterococcus sp. LJL99]
MKIKLKRQTTWGSVRYFTIYKNGVKQGKLFNSLSTDLEVEVGDVLEFREGLFKFCKKVVITNETKEVIISTTESIQQLFLTFTLSFLALSFLCYSIDSLKIFLFAEVSIFLLLNHLFRHLSYRFIILPTPLKESKSIHTIHLNNAHSH